jgi:hypothetical protein
MMRRMPVLAQSTAGAQTAAQPGAQPDPNQLGPITVTAQSLNYNTLVGGPTGPLWQIQWQLSAPSQAGGWIVQHVVTSGRKPSQYQDYYEAWQVLPGSQFSVYADSEDPADDTFVGFSTVISSAAFYEGLNLPAGFIQNNPATAAGILYSTTNNPNLYGGTAPVYRIYSVLDQ